MAFLAAALVLWPLTAEAQRAYTVREGDTLAAIARRHHVTITELQRANRMRGTVVRPGERLQIPGRDGWRRARGRGRRYTVRAGDTLNRIARRFHVSVADLQAANALRSESIRQGQTLLVPRPGQSGASLRASLREGNAPVVPDIAPELEEDEAEAIQEQVVPGAEQTLREVRAGYNRGGFTFLDVSIAQTALHEARVRFVDALAEYHQAKVDYDRLTGRFIELVGGY